MQECVTFYVKYKSKKYPVRQIHYEDKRYLLAPDSLYNKIEWEPWDKTVQYRRSVDYFIPDKLIDADDKIIEEYIDKIHKLNYYENADFISIYNGAIHWWGYFYGDDGWHNVQYGGFETSIKDFVKKYHNNPSEAYEAVADNLTQYILSEDDLDPEEDTIEYFSSQLEDWLKNEDGQKVVEIKAKDITKKTPNGDYVILWEKEEKI